MNRLLLFCLLLGLTACQSEEKKETKATETETATTNLETPETATETPAPPSTPPLPALSMEKAKYIWDNCDYIDYVFYDLPFSMSLDQKKDIQGTIRNISASPVPQLRPECKSIGRIFYQVKGNNALSAEFYFSPQQGCYYYVFMEDEKPAFANLLTKEAVEYYNKTFATVNVQSADH